MVSVAGVLTDTTWYFCIYVLVNVYYRDCVCVAGVYHEAKFHGGVRVPGERVKDV